ncbi:hypothetical protein [Herbiconiux sp.]|uniref:hypothetical protein n=1 Tax=Herbiconiux sp. TaxID=1871186 RepID=UPI0025BDCE85|nr:hypothetical protein [Herbiconiux sp.]
MSGRAATSGATRAAFILAVSVAIAVTMSGCAGPAPAPGVSPESTAVGATSSPMPIEQVVAFDPIAEPLVAAGRSLVAGSDGFASLEARTALDVAVQQLDSSVQVAQLSAAGGPAASQATPPVDEASIAADLSALYAAIGTVRAGVIETAARVVNDETPDAPQAARDQLYSAIVAQQTAAAVPATDDTPRQLLELVALTRATQDAQVDGAAAAEAAAEESASSSDGSASGGGSPTLIPVPFPFPSRAPIHYCSDPVNLPDFCVDY